MAASVLPCWTNGGERRVVSYAAGAYPSMENYSLDYSYKNIRFGEEDTEQNIISQNGASTFIPRDGFVTDCSLDVPCHIYQMTSLHTYSSPCVNNANRTLHSPVVPGDQCGGIAPIRCRHVSFGGRVLPGLEGWPSRNCGGGRSTGYLEPNFSFFCNLDLDEGGWTFGGSHDPHGNWWESWSVEHIRTDTDLQETKRLAVTCALLQPSALCEYPTGGQPECP